MLDKYHIEDSITKFQAYRVIITDTKDINYMKRGDIISSESIFYFNLYLDLYLYLIQYSLLWFDESDEYREDEAPLSLDEISDIIDKGNELINILIETPLNA